jgi:hypothetical protein
LPLRKERSRRPLARPQEGHAEQDGALKDMILKALDKAEYGANVNQAESYFSRLRRAEIGQHHRISGCYLSQ